MSDLLKNIAFTPSEYTPFMQTAMVDLGNDVSLCIEAGGDPKNPPLLLIMGLGCQLLYWPDDFVKKLIDKGYYVIRYDNRDIGLSTKFKNKHQRPNFLRLFLNASRGKASHNEPVPYNLKDMADDAKRLIDILGFDSVHILGASMGGMIAQILAAKHPEKVRGLGLLFTSNNRSFMPPPFPKQLIALFAKPKNHKEETLIEHGVYFFNVIGSPGLVDDDFVRKASRIMLKRSHYPLGYIQHLNAILATGSLFKYDKKITAPTVVVHGSKDYFVHSSRGKAVARAIKGAKFYKIKGMGHDFPAIFQDKMVNIFTENYAKADG